MPKINDLNLKNWKEKNIKFYGDKYKIRKTYDIDDVGIGRYGFDIYNERNKLINHFVGDNINELEKYIKAIFYKNYAICPK